MPVLTRSKSQYVQAPKETGWGIRLAEAVDEAVQRIGADRDVIGVATTPITAAAPGSSVPQTAGVIVTVTWREG